MSTIRHDIEGGGYEYRRQVPNDLQKTVGTKAVSIAITQKITGTDKYYQITSGIALFPVGESLASADYEAIENDTAILLSNNPIAAGEFDALGFSAGEIDDKEIKAGQFDVMAKTVLK